MGSQGENLILSQLGIIGKDIKDQIALSSRLEANQQTQKEQLQSIFAEIADIKKTDAEQTKQILTHIQRVDGIDETLKDLKRSVSKKQDAIPEALHLSNSEIEKAKYDYKKHLIAKIAAIITGTIAIVGGMLEASGTINLLK